MAQKSATPNSKKSNQMTSKKCNTIMEAIHWFSLTTAAIVFLLTAWCFHNEVIGESVTLGLLANSLMFTCVAIITNPK